MKVLVFLGFLAVGLVSAQQSLPPQQLERAAYDSGVQDCISAVNRCTISIEERAEVIRELVSKTFPDQSIETQYLWGFGSCIYKYAQAYNRVNRQNASPPIQDNGDFTIQLNVAWQTGFDEVVGYFNEGITFARFKAVLIPLATRTYGPFGTVPAQPGTQLSNLQFKYLTGCVDAIRKIKQASDYQHIYPISYPING